MKKLILFLILAGAAAVYAARTFAPALTARANVFDNLWEKVAPYFSWPGSDAGDARQNGETAPDAAADGATRATDVPLYKPALDYERAVVEAVKKASPAVVSITVSKNVPVLEDCPIDPFMNLPPEFRGFLDDRIQFFGQCEKGTRLQEIGGGSGFIISSDGMILTNKHVIRDAKASYTVFTNDGKKYDAKVLARDPVQDLAVVKIDPSMRLGAGAGGFPVVTLGDSDSIELGQTAIAIGNALAEFRNTVSVGVISGLARTVTAGDASGFSERIQGVVQTDAAINPGNSGGPLLNLRGEVIGVNTAIVSGAQSIGFAIPINRAKRAIKSVKDTGEIQTAFLGVRYLSVTPELAKAEKLPVDHGALLRGTKEGPAVTEDSPAAKAGLLAEDIVTAVNGKRVDEDHPLIDLISDYNVGDTITLSVRRGEKELEVKVILGKRPE